MVLITGLEEGLLPLTGEEESPEEIEEERRGLRWFDQVPKEVDPLFLRWALPAFWRARHRPGSSSRFPQEPLAETLQRREIKEETGQTGTAGAF